MVKIRKIFTRNGDHGETHLANGQKVPKSDPKFELSGIIDQLTVDLGYLLLELEDSHVKKQLASVQSRTFDLGAEVAQAEPRNNLHIQDDDITALENWIAKLSHDLPELTSFVLPGSSKLDIAIHRCRITTRAAERCAWKIHQKETLNQTALVFLNRLSDYFFALSRYFNHFHKSQERLWKPGKVLG